MLSLCMCHARNAKELMTPEAPLKQQEIIAQYPQVKIIYKTHTLLAIFLVFPFIISKKMFCTQILDSHLTLGKAA